MTKAQEDLRAASFHISQGLGSFLVKDFGVWLQEDGDRLIRASRLLTILRRDPANTLNVRPTDIFRQEHLAFSEISEAAEERANDDEDERPHLKVCTLCNAFVEVEAARLVIQRGLETDMDSVYGQVFRTPTDNDKWFGKRLEDRI